MLHIQIWFLQMFSQYKETLQISGQYYIQIYQKKKDILFSTLKTKGGRSSRADRILMRGPNWIPIQTTFVGGQPKNETFPSDHFGLIAKVSIPLPMKSPDSSSIHVESEIRIDTNGFDLDARSTTISFVVIFGGAVIAVLYVVTKRQQLGIESLFNGQVIGLE